MPFHLENIVPWGRSYEEYVSMFALSDEDLKEDILDCGGGPSSFCSDLTGRGGRAVSADPLYRFPDEGIRARVEETRDEIVRQLGESMEEYLWDRVKGIEELVELRMASMNDFLLDFERGKKEGRYVDAELPDLPFADNAFGIALCSHLLFLYSAQLSLKFHLDSIRELCRVAGEARIYPIIEMGTLRSRHLSAVLRTLKEEGYSTRVIKVPYEFLRGADEMLVVSQQAY